MKKMLINCKFNYYNYGLKLMENFALIILIEENFNGNIRE